MNTAQIMGYTDWRLPTSAELTALYNAGTSGLTTAGWTLDNTWSATAAGAGNHYIVHLGNGGVNSLGDSYYSYVSCVH